MAIRKREVIPFTVDYVCDSCGVGVMHPTGISLLCSQPQYPHECDKCGESKTFNNKYPYMSYELVKGLA